jgi:hypothetical protein
LANFDSGKIIRTVVPNHFRFNFLIKQVCQVRKRRSRGEGTIFFWEERNLWVARFTLPEGKRKVKYGKTQKEVREWLSTSLNQLRQGVLVENDNVTVAQFFERYLEDFGSHSLRPSTYASYKHNIHNHIIPAIGISNSHHCGQPPACPTVE